MKPTVEQDEMFPEGINPPNWEVEEVKDLIADHCTEPLNANNRIRV